ncbi:MAG TPA: L-aspartate oxidase [Terrisporobacter glycolicus]|uniref:L-aspartate oxidase n=1 Tax=Terrisporobacter petrolearius TaxID=1460447 RepID=A0ABZ3F9B0_9FIRM|nr:MULTISPECIES: L-aspartate oxidase [Terrisporobacter]MBN9648252.1 L-aspartate oxidase [Terrisporobacter glycolicus]HBI91863.1 L-aspartate oxidase [Terrisporobacter hibernicus]
MENKYVDVLVVGSGVAGLYCALNLRQDLDVMVISKDKIDCTNTSLAQGGISVARDLDDVPFFTEDTLKAGKYKNNIQAVNVLTKESIENVDYLVSLGLNVDKDEDGNWDYTKEGAHCVNRIIHTQDNTGENVEKTLVKNSFQRKNIRISEDTFLVDIIERNNKCIGAILLKDKEQINVFAKFVVLACGGIGGLYKNSTSQRILRGDGLAVALRHEIELKDINYIQIHPTAFYDESGDERRFLISESVRGEGGKLYNINGERFVDELQPRDVVSDAIFNEMKKTNTPYVYLDISFLDEEYLKNRFSTIYNKCLEKGTDITKEPIKVSPAQHYFMGGIKVDLNSKTSMKNLYAVGETACTGIHGANRLASNSLLEGLVFSKRAAKYINENIDQFNLTKVDIDEIYTTREEIEEENKRIVVNAIKDKGGVIDD